MGDLSANINLAEWWPASAGPCPDIQRIKAGYLAVTLWQPLRDKFGKINYARGYSSPEHNATVPGASKTSDHMWIGDACCADGTFADSTPTNDLRYSALAYLVQHCPHGFGQAIIYPRDRHLHLSLPTIKHQGEIRVAAKDGTFPEIRWRDLNAVAMVEAVKRLMAANA